MDTTPAETKRVCRLNFSLQSAQVDWTVLSLCSSKGSRPNNTPFPLSLSLSYLSRARALLGLLLPLLAGHKRPSFSLDPGPSESAQIFGFSATALPDPLSPALFIFSCLFNLRFLAKRRAAGWASSPASPLHFVAGRPFPRVNCLCGLGVCVLSVQILSPSSSDCRRSSLQVPLVPQRYLSLLPPPSLFHPIPNSFPLAFRVRAG